MGLLAAFVAALGTYDTVALGGVTGSGGWPTVALYGATALLLLIPYGSDRARSLCHRVVRTGPVRAGLALFGLGALTLTAVLVVDFARAPPGEFEAAIAVAFWVLILGGSGVSVVTAAIRGERDSP
ncbi:hypothetical protein I7X12_13995 [Halosimplex litoreum]|uniref:Uncharacterized protein n=1 Tax=Halosimplex litoreum TaxID=1198301 RepID=A0A7T3KU35_9EURY|nr:hypothetical protein [Halosimplex litoreum]QPV61857.1 hypothetical protein I7X12_13995 [Halosimplex litoreum]